MAKLSGYQTAKLSDGKILKKAFLDQVRNSHSRERDNIGRWRFWHKSGTRKMEKPICHDLIESGIHHLFLALTEDNDQAFKIFPFPLNIPLKTN